MVSRRDFGRGLVAALAGGPMVLTNFLSGDTQAGQKKTSYDIFTCRVVADVNGDGNLTPKEFDGYGESTYNTRDFIGVGARVRNGANGTFTFRIRKIDGSFDEKYTAVLHADDMTASHQYEPFELTPGTYQLLCYMDNTEVGDRENNKFHVQGKSGAVQPKKDTTKAKKPTLK